MSQLVATDLVEGRQPQTAAALSYKDLKAKIPVWASTVWNEVSADVITKGWEKIGVNKYWSADFQKEAEKNCVKLSQPVLKSNQRPRAPSTATTTTTTTTSTNVIVSDIEARLSSDSEEPMEEATEYFQNRDSNIWLGDKESEESSSDSQEETKNDKVLGRIDAFIGKAKRREHGCLHGCICERDPSLGTWKCNCAKKGCGPVCECNKYVCCFCPPIYRASANKH